MSATSKEPEFLYRYVSMAGPRADYLRDLMLNHRIYQPSPTGFNDPFDCRAGYDFDAPDEEFRKFFYRSEKRKNPRATDEKLWAMVDARMATGKYKNAEAFARFVRSLQLNSLEKSRNIVMHGGTVAKEDVERIGMNIRDWIRQAG